MTTYRLLAGDVRETLATLPEASVQCCVTSPPYWGLRDYGTATWEGGDSECDHTRPSRVNTEAAVKTSTLAGSKDSQGHLQEPSYRNVCGKCGAMRIDAQLGLEPTPDAYVANLVQVFREVRRVLKVDGTLWLNLGDSYAGGGYSNHDVNGERWKAEMNGDKRRSRQQDQRNALAPLGVKPKDLVGMVAFALRADGWYLRSDIIWSKPNPMPESVTDRPTKAHEYIFLLTKSARYYYDAAAIAEPAIHAGESRVTTAKSFAGQATGAGVKPTGNARPGSIVDIGETRNRRSVWTVATQPYSGAHFATFPEALIEPCILAGSREGDTVLDPFNGSGTTGAVSVRHRRHYIGCELNPEYIALARERIGAVAPLFAIEQDARTRAMEGR